jgi:hypothetical protein
VGLVLVRRRGLAGPAHGAVRGRGAPGLPVRPPPGRAGRRHVHRQRPPPVLRPPAHPAHDEHLGSFPATRGPRT